MLLSSEEKGLGVSGTTGVVTRSAQSRCSTEVEVCSNGHQPGTSAAECDADGLQLYGGTV